jgi:uncharacterized membrane protein
MMKLVTTYLVAAIGAYLLHLTVGITTAGIEKVRRQQRAFLDRHGYRGLVVFVLSMGIAYRNEPDDPTDSGGTSDR